ncbi:hypothetical protein DBA20_14255 [Pandoraea capi]|nr:hypothetical protein [Pandoraea sp. LA3]MDN4584148.1 hypothetical protein [Pandoraea capi]
MTAQRRAVMRECAPQRSRERLRLSVQHTSAQGHNNDCPTRTRYTKKSFNPSASGAVIQISVPTDDLGKTNMPRLALLSALVLAAVCAPAFAATPDDVNVVQLSTRQTIATDAVFNGRSGTVATLGADALRDAHGSFGVNVAAGALNVQSNQIVLANASNISVDTRQTIRNAATVTGAMNASLGDRALMGAAGNIGVNVAAGVANAQANALAIH